MGAIKLARRKCGGSILFEFPNFDPVAVSLGPLKVRWYGLMYLLSFAIGWLLARHRSKRPGTPIAAKEVEDLVFYLALGVFIGGRVGYMLIYGFSSLLADPLSLFKVWDGGMSFHGGMLGVGISLWFFARRLRQPYFAIVDFIAPLAPIGLGFGRIGNFINGELWGKPTDLPWAVIVDGVPRHPNQLYEALLEGLVLFTILWVYSSKPRPAMSLTGLFFVGYGLFRCGIEFIRIPDAQMGYLAWGWLTTGQLLSAPMVLVGGYFLWAAYRRGSGATGS